ncbi:MAG: hypothetical protein HDR31_00770 [Mycoplasma sp.]|nr:hypothetical protein [Mycoplasma sp.]
MKIFLIFYQKEIEKKYFKNIFYSFDKHNLKNKKECSFYKLVYELDQFELNYQNIFFFQENFKINLPIKETCTKILDLIFNKFLEKKNTDKEVYTYPFYELLQKISILPNYTYENKITIQKIISFLFTRIKSIAKFLLKKSK